MTAIYKMTYNKIMFDKKAGKDLEKYVVIVNNLYEAKQLTEKERDELLSLIGWSYHPFKLYYYERRIINGKWSKNK